MKIKESQFRKILKEELLKYLIEQEGGGSGRTRTVTRDPARMPDVTMERVPGEPPEPERRHPIGASSIVGGLSPFTSIEDLRGHQPPAGPGLPQVGIEGDFDLHGREPQPGSLVTVDRHGRYRGDPHFDPRSEQQRMHDERGELEALIHPGGGEYEYYTSRPEYSGYLPQFTAGEGYTHREPTGNYPSRQPESWEFESTRGAHQQFRDIYGGSTTEAGREARAGDLERLNQEYETRRGQPAPPIPSARFHGITHGVRTYPDDVSAVTPAPTQERPAPLVIPSARPGPAEPLVISASPGPADESER